MKVLFKALFLSAIIILSFKSYSEDHALSSGWELWYPYQYHNEQQKLTGLDFDVFNAIILEAKLSVKFTELPWKRHLHYLKTGEMDLAMGASLTSERLEYADFSLPYRKETVKLYVKKGSKEKIKLNHLKDLINSPYMIGVEGGYYYGENYQELIKQPKFQAQINEVIDIEENIELLLKGHIDGFLVDPVTMKAFIKKYKMDGEFEEHTVEIYSDDIYIMVSKHVNNKNVLPQINHAIKTLKENGKINEIINNWSQLQSIKSQ